MKKKNAKKSRDTAPLKNDPLYQRNRGYMPEVSVLSRSHNKSGGQTYYLLSDGNFQLAKINFKKVYKLKKWVITRKKLGDKR